MIEKGLVHYCFGSGKGKTTAALGLALRIAGHGGRATSFHFMKSSNRYGEFRAADKFKDLWRLTLCGPPCVNPRAGEHGFICEGCMSCHVTPGSPKPEDIGAAEKGLAEAGVILKAGSADLVILDEIGYAVELGLLKASAVLDAVRNRAVNVEVVLTGGWGRIPEFADLADYVTEMIEQNHHYKTGRVEVEGIDY